MHNKLITTILLLACFQSSIAQTCPSGNVTFDNQVQIDDFLNNYPNCTDLSGDVTIIQNANTSNPIINLLGLQNITNISGTLIIEENPDLLNLDGLQSLISIGGDFNIGTNYGPCIEINNTGDYYTVPTFGNPALVNLNELSNLQTIGGSLSIIGNDGLLDLGLNNLTSIGENFIAHLNRALISINLDNLNSLGGDIRIGKIMGCLGFSDGYDITIGNRKLQTIHMNSLAAIPGILELTGNFDLITIGGFNSLSNIGGQLRLRANHDLINFQGLNNLISIGTGLSVGGFYLDLNIGNNSLVNFQGLEKLQFISYIYIVKNNGLLSLDGLQNISNLSSATIRFNSLLSDCAIQPLCNLINTGGTTEITTNATGCVSEAEVLAACTFDCPTVDISLLTQADIDDFAINYPNCSELSTSLTVGDFNSDTYNQAITNLNGLSQITSITGDLEILNNDNLPNLFGLHNLEKVGANFLLEKNDGITNLEGLEKLEEVDMFFTIAENHNMQNLEGLDLLSLAGNGAFWIWNNQGLTSLIGLDNLTTVEQFAITNNDLLTDLTGLENISIANTFIVNSNDNLISFNGLNENINIDKTLNIYNNSNLSACAVTPICNNLPNVVSSIVHTNASGCNTTTEIETNCFLSNACPGDITLDSQSDIDNFATNYPGCNQIDGNLLIKQASGQSITNLNGLSQLTAVSGFLKIESNPNLQNLIGLNNMQYIGGDFRIRFNDNLSSLNGLNNLQFLKEDFMITNCPNLTDVNYLQNVTAIGGNVQFQWNDNLANFSGLCNLKNISGDFTLQGNNGLNDLSDLKMLTNIYGQLYIQANTALTDIELNRLETVGGDLTIRNHNNLSSLDGLEKLNSFNDELVLIGNGMLSVCNYPFICTHLSASLPSNINNNNTGCDTESEILTSCMDCPAAMYVSETKSNEFFEASAQNQVRADNKIQNGSYIIYKANNNVCLDPGFEVSNDSNFEIKIEDCNY